MIKQDKNKIKEEGLTLFSVLRTYIHYDGENIVEYETVYNIRSQEIDQKSRKGLEAR